VKLFTRTVGEGPDVVVLHGGPGAHHDYLLPQFDLLATGRRLRFYDQRGGGQSPAPRDEPLGWETHVADLLGLMDDWDLDQATLLGYSWGGLLAMLFAITHPGRVRRLALVSPAPSTTQGRARFNERFAARSTSPETLAAHERLSPFERAVAGYFHDVDHVHDLTPFRITGRTQDAVWKSLGDYDIRANLDQLDIPTRVFHGRHDVIPLDTAEDTARRLKAQLVVFEHSGHCPYVEETDRFVAEVGSWLPSA
jgi:proline iminopeptidase